MFCQIAAALIFGGSPHWGKGMNRKHYEDIKQSLLVAQHRIRQTRHDGDSYWMLHLREAEQLVGAALIQVEYARKAAEPGDRRND